MPTSPSQSSRRVLTLAVVLLVALLGLGGAAQAQGLNIPGLPGLPLGGGQDSAPAEEDGGATAGGETPAGEQAGNQGVSAPAEAPSPSGDAAAGQGGAAGAAATPTQTLIDLLRDDAAREELIRELEAASGQTAPAEGGAAPAGGAPPAGASVEAQGDTTEGAATEPAARAAPELTFGERAVAATRAVGGRVVAQMEGAWQRIQRIPSIVGLSGRAFEDGILMEALKNVAGLAVAVYAMLLVLRLLLSPIRRRLARGGAGAAWIKRMVRRSLVTVIDLATLPVAVFLGVFALFLAGTFQARADGGPELTNSQALFINAFIAVEVARCVLSFVLSPRYAELRLFQLPEPAIRSIWRAGQVVTYALGYGQLLIVPIVSTGVSVFVGRATASVLASVVVAGLILYVLLVRGRVARWLTHPDRRMPFGSALDGVLARWHWPVLAYLLYVLVTVMTRPGNVLLPLLMTTAEAALVVFVGVVLLSALRAASLRRLKVPGILSDRLPLLEERVNQLAPALLRVARLAVFVSMLVILADVIGLQDLGGLLSSEVSGRISSGLFSVLLIGSLLSAVWLALSSWVDYRLNPFVGSVPTPREITLLTLLRNAATVAIIIIGSIMSLAELGVNIAPLLASAGVIGLAISFGAQKAVEDIFSGIFIQAEGAMNVGDVVDVAGTVGTVEKLTVRSVTLRDLSGVVHVIPFSSASKISNYMRDFAYHVADIGVAYREDIAEVRQAMHDAFDALRQDEEQGSYVIGDLEWFGLNSFGASELVMRARIKTAPGFQWGVGRAYNAIVKRIFDERGIEIPFPHQTVYFGEDKSGRAPPVHMRVEGPGQTPANEPGGPLPAPFEAETADGQQIRGTDMPGSDD